MKKKSTVKKNASKPKSGSSKPKVKPSKAKAKPSKSKPSAKHKPKASPKPKSLMLVYGLGDDHQPRAAVFQEKDFKLAKKGKHTLSTAAAASQVSIS